MSFSIDVSLSNWVGIGREYVLCRQEGGMRIELIHGSGKILETISYMELQHPTTLRNKLVEAIAIFELLRDKDRVKWSRLQEVLE